MIRSIINGPVFNRHVKLPEIVSKMCSRAILLVSPPSLEVDTFHRQKMVETPRMEVDAALFQQTTGLKPGIPQGVANVDNISVLKKNSPLALWAQSLKHMA